MTDNVNPRQIERSLRALLARYHEEDEPPSWASLAIKLALESEQPELRWVGASPAFSAVGQAEAVNYHRDHLLWNAVHYDEVSDEVWNEDKGSTEARDRLVRRSAPRSRRAAAKLVQDAHEEAKLESHAIKIAERTRLEAEISGLTKRLVELKARKKALEHVPPEPKRFGDTLQTLAAPAADDERRRAEHGIAARGGKTFNQSDFEIDVSTRSPLPDSVFTYAARQKLMSEAIRTAAAMSIVPPKQSV